MSVDSNGHGGVVMEVKSIEILDFRGSVYKNRGKPPYISASLLIIIQ